ncbi:MAG: DUF2726 domain-containing protein, partial [Gammaproteobacteria bacterium]|nr:DUF2726 domain-containing protein [Gammaproteobacteria bacterium]
MISPELIVGIGLLIVILLLAVAFRRRPPTYTYVQEAPLFTDAETAFLEELDAALPESLRLFGKVRIADILQPAAGLDRSTWRTAFNRIAAKHVDYLLCDRDTLEPVLAVELDDASHARADRSERDEFLDLAFEQAGLPLLRVPAAARYDQQALHDAIEDAASAGPALRR